MAKFLTDQEIDELLEVKTNEFMKKKEITFNFNIKELENNLKVLKNNKNYSKDELMYSLSKTLKLSEDLNDLLKEFSSQAFGISDIRPINKIINKLNNKEFK